MELNTALIGTGTGSSILGILYLIYKIELHKRCKSRCCKEQIEFSIDVGNTTPPDLEAGFSKQNKSDCDSLPSK